MLKQNIITPSSSPWNSPVWIVPKKADASGRKKWRIVIDYRKLNEISVGDSYPLPNIIDILDQLGHSKYFTTIDLTSGFHQIPMDPEDASKTAFSVPTGHYQFQRMPFGLRNAPSTFQRLMNTVPAGIQNSRCFVYLDDIVVYGADLQTHNSRLKEVFDRLAMYNFKIQPDKCEFLRKEVMYLGHLITENGVKPDPSKVEAVQQYPQPKSQNDIRSFLGLAGYYRRFISDFSKIAQPLTKLLKKGQAFQWTSAQEEAFESLKSSITSEPLLIYPDFTQPFILSTDASNYAIGTILSQGKIDEDRLIAYTSRTLNKAEGNYSTIEKELLAIVWATKHFRPYLYGRKFLILSDHRPLKYLFSVKDPSSRLLRWRLAIEEYNYEIDYRARKKNQHADSLGRIQLESQVTQINQTSEEDTYEDFIHSLSHQIITFN
ncbi:hypothetical protein Trydic_g8477, partial [Trypoxylus dichotomus]